jgi:serine/threonine protein kinase
MAPEIFEMQEYDAKADIWSVGCVFYEMLGNANLIMRYFSSLFYL